MEIEGREVQSKRECILDSSLLRETPPPPI